MIKFYNRLVAEDLVKFLNAEPGNYGWYTKDFGFDMWLKESDTSTMFYPYEQEEAVLHDIKLIDKLRKRI